MGEKSVGGTAIWFGRFSASSVVVLLSAIAFLLYANYVHEVRTSGPDISKGTPPPAPRPLIPLIPLPIIQPPVQQPTPPAPRERVEVGPPAPQFLRRLRKPRAAAPTPS